MKRSKDIPIEVEDTFEVLKQIREVKVSASFQQNVLNSIEKIAQEKITFTWFTPQLQLAAMLLVLLVNTSVIVYTFSVEKQASEIDNFAQEYSFNTTDTLTLN